MTPETLDSYRDEVSRLLKQRDQLRSALAEAIEHVEPVDQNSELAIARWRALL